MIGFAVATTEEMRLSAGELLVPDTMLFLNDADSGLVTVSADVVGVQTGGTVRAQVSSAGVQLVPLGTVGAPSFAWTTAPTTGLFLETTTRLACSCLETSVESSSRKRKRSQARP